MRPSLAPDEPEAPPERFPVRAIAYGMLAGPALFASIGVVVFVLGGIEADLVHGIADVFALLFYILFIFALTFGIGVPIGALCALPCLLALIWAEERLSIARTLPIWISAGTLFALPAAWVMSPEDYDGHIVLGEIFFLVTGSGTVGGFAAWFAYYGRLPQISSRNSSRTER